MAKIEYGAIKEILVENVKYQRKGVKRISKNLIRKKKFMQC